MTEHSPRPRFVFFGTPLFAALVLEELEKEGYLPSLIVTAPDKPKGRKLVLTPSEVRLWGEKRGIPVITPDTLRDSDIEKVLTAAHADVFIVAAYGKIIPKNILAIPPRGTLNVHPSLLPKFRGASPIESAILSEDTCTGVTIIVLDEEMDHGPILAQRERVRNDWPPRGSVLTADLARFGGQLLAEILPEWMAGLTPTPQDHSRATFTKKITKDDGLINITDDPELNLKKIRAFDDWPGAFFFTLRNGRNTRIRVTDARIEDGVLKITRVIPEGKSEMDYADFLRGGQNTKE